jgi:tryptophan synthase alpha subunit
VDLVLKVAPTTSGAHLAELGAVAGGFVYCAADDAAGLAPLVEHVRLHTDLPVVVPSVAGTPEEVAALSRLADGVLVAVALVSVTGSDAEDDLMLDVSEVVRSLKEATHKSDPVR